MCTRSRFGLAALVGILFCSLAWLTASKAAMGDDTNDTRTQRNPLGYRADTSNDTASNPQAGAEAQQGQPQPISLSGTGRQATQKFRLEPGFCVFDVSHDGNSNLIIKLLDHNGKEIDTVINQIGKFNGQRGINIPTGDVCLLDVQADGNWKANISQPRPTQGQAVPATLQGKGYQVTPVLQLERGLAEFKMKHDGQDRFKVVLLDQNGKPIEYLTNTIGKFDGSKPISVEEPGLYFLNVSADGNWTIDVQ